MLPLCCCVTAEFWVPVCFPSHFSRASFPSIKPLCATMQRLITLSINTSLPAPGRWGSSRNSRCLLLLLTSASTAVKLDHYDANLRLCCNPGEEPGSVRLIEREEASKSVPRGGRGECMRIAVRETDRDSCLGVIVNTVMMKQLSSPPCYNDKSSVWLSSIFTEIHPLIPSFCQRGYESLRNREYFHVPPLAECVSE